MLVGQADANTRRGTLTPEEVGQTRPVQPQLRLAIASNGLSSATVWLTYSMRTRRRTRSEPTVLALPAWARKQPQMTEVLPLLYLHGLSTSDFGPALEQFLGSGAGLSAWGHFWAHSVSTEVNPGESHQILFRSSVTVRLRGQHPETGSIPGSFARLSCCLRAWRDQESRLHQHRRRITWSGSGDVLPAITIRRASAADEVSASVRTKPPSCFRWNASSRRRSVAMALD